MVIGTAGYKDQNLCHCPAHNPHEGGSAVYNERKLRASINFQNQEVQDFEIKT